MKILLSDGQAVHVISFRMRNFFEGYLEGIPGYDSVLASARGWAERETRYDRVPVHVVAPPPASAGEHPWTGVGDIFPVMTRPWQCLAVLSSDPASSLSPAAQRRLGLLWFFGDPRPVTFEAMFTAACRDLRWDALAVSWESRD